MTAQELLSGLQFEASSDFTLGVEEEFQILDPASMALINGYPRLLESCPQNLRPHLKGELIASEIEIATPKCNDFEAVRRELYNLRGMLSQLARQNGFALGSTGAHPFSPWQDQEIIDTPHYRKVTDELGYVAWTNNTFGFHVHIGVNGRERAIKACDAFRNYLPLILALSASSPFYLSRLTGLHSVRTQLFTKNFPRCGLPEAFSSWGNYEKYLHFLFDTDSIKEFTQVWWSVRPHVQFGTVEIRIADGQPDIEDTLALAAFILALMAKVLQQIDDGFAFYCPPRYLLEENLWRATRNGLQSSFIDPQSIKVLPAVDSAYDLLRWTEDAYRSFGLSKEKNRLERILQRGNSSQEQINLYRQGNDFETIHHFFSARSMAAGERPAAVGDFIGAEKVFVPVAVAQTSQISSGQMHDN